MFEKVDLEQHSFEDYRSIIEPALYDEVLAAAGKLKGKRILEVSATPKGGGVAEILHSQVPLELSLGIKAEWWVLKGNEPFFEVTKMIHNAMQGGKQTPSEQQWQLYEDLNRQLAAELKPGDWDYIMIHDPQPVAIRQFVAGAEATKWAWRCHVDTSFPNPDVGQRISGYVKDYDGAVFSLGQYILPNLRDTSAAKHLATIPVAIDPLSRKNRGVPRVQARLMVDQIGVDTTRPFIVQISRFDPWKDPLGVVEAWRLAKAEVPGLQLVLMGDAAADDPEGARILALVKEHTKGLRDVYLVTRNDELLVNALQQTATVVLQKSLREGFGLTVSEALWAGRPVIGGDVGGIPLQIEDGVSGYLVTSVVDAAERIATLVQNPEKALAMGAAGHERVRQQFLLPRMLRDQLAFWSQLA